MIPGTQNLARRALNWISWIGLAMLVTLVLAVIASIASRFPGVANTVIINDIQQYAFSVLILLSILIAYVRNRHVDARFTAKPTARGSISKVWFGIWTCTFVVLPFMIIALVSLPYISLAWSTWEASREQGGLPGYFLIKTCLPVFAFLIASIALGKVVISDNESES